MWLIVCARPTYARSCVGVDVTEFAQPVNAFQCILCRGCLFQSPCQTKIRLAKPILSYFEVPYARQGTVLYGAVIPLVVHVHVCSLTRVPLLLLLSLSGERSIGLLSNSSSMSLYLLLANFCTTRQTFGTEWDLCPKAPSPLDGGRIGWG